MALISNLRDRLHKRAIYRRTLNELRAMPLDIALDLDIQKADAHRIAAQAVYGRPAA